MARNSSDDFFAFALDGASHERPAPNATPPGPAPPSAPASSFTPPPFVPPVSPPTTRPPTTGAPGSLPPEFSLDDDPPFQAPSRTMMALMKARESPRATISLIVVFIVLVIAAYRFASSGDAGATGKRFEAAAGQGGAKTITTPAGPVAVPGRAKVTAATEVVRDPDAPADQRRVACTLAVGDEVVLSAAEDANGLTRVRVQGAAPGCEGWLAAAALAP